MKKISNKKITNILCALKLSIIITLLLLFLSLVNAGSVIVRQGLLNVSSYLYVDSSGNVGIGTVTPAEKLSVLGNLSINKTFYVLETGRVGIGTTAPNFLLDVAGTINASDLNISGSGYFGGKVGIGTISPSASLTVIGEINGSGLNISGGAYIGGNVGIGTITPGAQLTVIGEVNATGLNISGVGYFGGNVGIGTITPAAKLTVIGEINASSLNISGSGYFGGRVGIGKTSPNFELDVAGTINASELNITGITLGGVRRETWGGAGIWNNVSDNAVYTAGSAAVGTTTPASKFDVAQGATTSANIDHNSSPDYVAGFAWNASLLNVTSVSGFPTAGALIIDSEAITYSAVDTTLNTFTNLTRGALGTTAANHTNNTAVYFLTTSVTRNTSLTPYMVVRSDGNIGIGTTLPTHTLTVSGDLNVTGKSYLGTFEIKNDLIVGNINISGTSNKVGIGTTSPSAALTVIGEINGSGLNISGDAYIGGDLNVTGTSYLGTFKIQKDLIVGNINISGTSNKVGIGTTSPAAELTVIGEVNASSLNISGSGYFGGRVGIGTTSPGKELDVAGTINATTIEAVDTLTIGGGFGDPGLTVDKEGNIKTDGDILFSGNLTVIDVDHLRVNGSFYPSLTATFDIGNGSLRWRNANFSGVVSVGTLTDGTMQVTSGTITGASMSADQISAGALDIGDNILAAGEINGSGLNISGRAYIGGNVGIGTLTPTSKLHVIGDLNVSGTSYLGDTVISADNITVSDIVAKYENISFYNATKDEKMRITYDGKVGIGTTAPAHKLTVEGTVNATGLNISGDVALAVDSGRVGIGTVSPNVLLDVAGTINASDLNISGSGYFGGKVGIGTIAPAATLTVIGEVNASSLNISGSGYFGGRVGIGTTSPNFELDVAGTINASELNITEGITLGGVRRKTWGGAGIWNNVSGNAVYIAGSAAVGTTTPASKFDVAQGATTSANIDHNSSPDYVAGFAWNASLLNVTSVSDFPTAGTLIIESEAITYSAVDTTLNTFTNLTRGALGTTAANHTNNTAVYFLTTSVTRNTSLTPYMVVRSDGNIGIGTTLPTSELHVIGNLNVSGTSYLGSMVFEAGNITAGRGTFTTLNVTGTAYLGDTTIESDNITVNNIKSRDGNLSFFNDSDNELMRITSDGYVGIGTITPTSTLHVIGSLNVSGASYLGTFTIQDDLIVGNINISGTSNKVGIGTTSPNAELTVIGEINGSGLNISGDAYIGGNVGIGTISPQYKLQIVDTDKALNVSGVLYVNGSSGNVGIGTSNPNEKLTVVGNINVTGNITSGSGSVFIDGTNNKIGIGTTSPAESLDVNGNIILSSSTPMINVSGPIIKNVGNDIIISDS